MVSFSRAPSSTLRHEYYVYHDGATVYARIRGREPVVAEEMDTPQAAYDRVQSIVNPTKRAHDSFEERGPDGKTSAGFNSEEFQAAISANCEEYVKAAYENEV